MRYAMSTQDLRGKSPTILQEKGSGDQYPAIILGNFTEICHSSNCAAWKIPSVAVALSSNGKY